MVRRGRYGRVFVLIVIVVARTVLVMAALRGLVECDVWVMEWGVHNSWEELCFIFGKTRLLVVHVCVVVRFV